MQLESIERTVRAAQSTANLMRLSMEGPANESLVAIVDGMTELLSDLAPDRAQPIGALLVEIVSAQERRDFIGVADLVEFGLMPHLEEAARTA